MSDTLQVFKETADCAHSERIRFCSSLRGLRPRRLSQMFPLLYIVEYCAGCVHTERASIKHHPSRVDASSSRRRGTPNASRAARLRSGTAAADLGGTAATSLTRSK